MSPEPEQEVAREHRPLPSVDVALLPHELRAARTRTVAIVIALLLVVGVGAGLLFAGRLRTAAAPEPVGDSSDGWPIAKHEGTPAVTAPPAAGSPASPAVGGAPVAVQPPAAAVSPSQVGATPPPDPSVAMDGASPGESTRRTVRFGQARGFRDALRKTGGSPTESDAIITALTNLVDFRRCRPEHQLVWDRAEDGSLAGFEYKAGLTEVYRASPGPGGKLVGKRVEIPVETKRIAKGGRVAGSLGRALEHQGLGRSLVGVFVEVFERTVSFKKDTRTGDSFRIIVDEEYVEKTLQGYGATRAVEYNGERTGQLRAFWFEPRGRRGDFFDDKGREMNGGWLRTPLRYDHISSPFNPRRRHPVLKRIMPHNGVDYAASPGTQVRAAADGVIIFAGYKGANGNLVGISHSGGYETYYAHLSRISRGIKRGVEVSQRTPIGAVGSTGRSTGPHLHFALKRKGRFVDPMGQLNGPGKPLPAREMPRFKRERKALLEQLQRIPLGAAPSDTEPVAEPAGPGEQFHEEAALEL